MCPEMIHEPKEAFIPVPLSLQRHSQPVTGREEAIVVDVDEKSNYMAVSLRKSPYMSVQEDRYTFQENIMHAPYNAFYAVFDGHAGYQAS